MAALGVLVGKVFVHARHLKELVIEALHTQLVVFGHVDEEDVLLLDELLFLGKDLLGVVLGKHGVRAYIILRNQSVRDKNLPAGVCQGDYTGPA